MTVLSIAIFSGLLLAYANGANDNFKGVATLFGSGTTTYKKALAWATLTTFLGSLAALILAKGLVATFSGKGLVPAEIAAMKSFMLSVALAAGATVLLATRLGFPISTTHALTGALVGSGLIATGSSLNFHKLGSGFFVPLLTSPFIALLATAALYPVFKAIRLKLRIESETCVCVGTEIIATLPQGTSREQALAAVPLAVPSIQIGMEPVCRDKYTGTVFGVSARGLMDNAHFISAGAVGFARGLNDTPKIAALLLAGQALSPTLGISMIAIVIALGGLISAKRVAETMAHRITEMNSGQGFSANLVTSSVVIAASMMSLPVSTTHVSCGALFGIGATTSQAKWKTIAVILMAWVTTLPVAAAISAMSFYLLKGMT